MAGKKKGVATVIKNINGKCLYTHCYRHALNLTVGDLVKNVKLLADTFGTIKELRNLIKKSPKRETHLKKLRDLSENKNRSSHSFCPARWAIRGQSCQALIDNYEKLMELWEWSVDSVQEAEMKVKIRGVQSYMQQLKFLFGCHLGKMILNLTDILSKALQDESWTAVEGQDAAMKTVKALESTRNEYRYKDFMKAVKANQNHFEIDEPSLTRKRRQSECVDHYFQPSTYHFPESNEQIFCRIYFEALDNAIQAIKAHFDQTYWFVYKNIQDVFLNTLKGGSFQENLDVVMDTFCYDLQEELEAQLITLKFYPDEPITDAKELVKFLQGPTAAQRRLMLQVVILAKLLLVMPATNAVSE